jgi:hypothetical protein
MMNASNTAKNIPGSISFGSAQCTQLFNSPPIDTAVIPRAKSLLPGLKILLFWTEAGLGPDPIIDTLVAGIDADEGAPRRIIDVVGEVKMREEDALRNQLITRVEKWSINLR